MKQILNAGDKITLQQFGACPNWKLQYVGQTAKVLNVEHNRVELVRCNSNIYWPLEAVKRVENDQCL